MPMFDVRCPVKEIGAHVRHTYTRDAMTLLPGSERPHSESDPMNEETLLARITIDPEVLSGKPVIQGTRISVAFVIGLLASGMTRAEILDEYPVLSEEDLIASLRFAQRSLESASFMPLRTRSA